MSEYIRVLKKQLVDTERAIASGEANGQDVTTLIAFWCELLNQYERTVVNADEAQSIKKRSTP